MQPQEEGRTYRVFRRLRWILLGSTLSLGVFFGVLLILAQAEPKSQMILDVDCPPGNNATFVFKNPTKHPASIHLQKIEVQSNGVWVAFPPPDDQTESLVLHAGKSLEVSIEASRGFPWRARFTSIEKNTGLSALAYRVHLTIDQARSRKGLSSPKGEVYHDVSIVSPVIFQGQNQH